MNVLARLLGGVSLCVAVVLAVVLIGQGVYGPGRMLLPSLVGAPLAFWIAWSCSTFLAEAEKDERKRLEAEPRPVAAPSGELVLGMRWVKWLLGTLLFGGLGTFGVLVVLVAGRAMNLYGALAGMFCAGVLLPSTLFLLATAYEALRLGGLARLDAQGFRHALLPMVPWTQVRGVDLELQVPLKGPRHWNLVLAVAPAFARTLRVPRWWRVVGPGAPRLDGEGRLTVPLAYARGKPQVLAGMAMSVADRWGAPRIGGWRAWQDPDWAAERNASRVSSVEATRTVERLIGELRQRRGGTQHG